MEFSDLIDLAKQTAADVKDKVSDPSGKVSDAVSDIVSKLNEALPYLAKAGYTMDCLEIEVGIWGNGVLELPTNVMFSGRRVLFRIHVGRQRNGTACPQSRSRFVHSSCTYSTRLLAGREA